VQIGTGAKLSEVSMDEARRIASVAHIALDDEKLERVRLELTRLSDCLAELEQLDTSDVEPTAYVITAINICREDESIPGMPSELIVQNAPDSVEGFIRVPAFMEEE
jgi:aspartyl-tRNA(Asn)/glutamyl-tRNA(Gln) amidotransferase subunit C